MFRRVSLAIATMIAVLLPSTAAHAAIGDYTVNPTGGVMYQTNTWYYSDTIDLPTTLPANASIITVYWSYSFSNHTQIVAQLCTPDGLGQQLCLSLPNDQATGTITAWAGLPAQRSWTFRFIVLAPTVMSLGTPRIGGQHSVRVRYGYLP